MWLGRSLAFPFTEPRFHMHAKHVRQNGRTLCLQQKLTQVVRLINDAVNFLGEKVVL